MKVIVALLLLLVLPSVTFAQFGRTQDIGELLFRDILKMTEYPGAPFTGNIINDIVMLFFIPTVFIILVITILVLRIGLPSQRLAVLLGIAFYLFIVFGGYFRIFALLAGPYFLFMLIIIGIFAFLLGHFGIGTRGGAPAAGGGRMSGSAVGTTLEGADTSLAKQLVLKQIMMREQEAGLQRARQSNDPRTGEYESRVAQLRAEIKVLEGEVRYDVGEQAAYARLRHKYHV